MASDILVFGAGSLGMVFGGLLAERGHRVRMVGRRRHVDAVRKDGVHVEGIWGEHHAHVEEAVESVDELTCGPVELVLICVKSFDTAAAVAAISPVVGPETLVVHLQNGYGNMEVSEQVYGPSRSVGARVIFGVDVVGDGRVKVTVIGGPVLVGSRTNAIPSEKLAAIAAAFADAGIPSEPTEQVQQWLWGKIAYNAALNPLGALLGVQYGRLGEIDPTRELMRRVVCELFAVTRAAEIPMLWTDAQAFLADFYRTMLPPTAEHYPSMLADLLAGRNTEIDALNGAVGKLGRRLAVQTPVNGFICTLVRAREQAAQPR